VEGHLPDQPWLVQTPCHVLWPHEQSHHLSDDDGRHLCEDLISEGIVMVYLDDILIFTETLEEHQKITSRVLELLEKHKLYLRSDKCEFKKTTIEYLGVIISHNSIAMDPVKITGITKWPAPTNKKEVQSFLGFTNFYRRFIRDFSEHTHLLFDLTQNNSSWHWGEAEHTAFARLKGSVTSALVLISPDLTKPFRIEADSSNFATGVVLSQVSSEDEKWHPVAFLSKSLSPVEGNYKIHDKEMLAIIRALQEWQHFIKGAEHQCEIWTRSQEPGVLHDSQATELEASPMVSLPLLLQLRTPSQTQEVNG